MRAWRLAGKKSQKKFDWWLTASLSLSNELAVRLFDSFFSSSAGYCVQAQHIAHTHDLRLFACLQNLLFRPASFVDGRSHVASSSPSITFPYHKTKKSPLLVHVSLNAGRTQPDRQTTRSTGCGQTAIFCAELVSEINNNKIRFFVFLPLATGTGTAPANTCFVFAGRQVLDLPRRPSPCLRRKWKS